MMIEKFDALRKTKAKMQVLEDSLSIVRAKIKFHSVTNEQHHGVFFEDPVLNKLENELNDLENKKSQLQHKYNMILKELSVIPEPQREILMYKYVYGLDWGKISQKTGYTHEQTLKFYKEAKKQFYSDSD